MQRFVQGRKRPLPPPFGGVVESQRTGHIFGSGIAGARIENLLGRRHFQAEYLDFRRFSKVYQGVMAKWACNLKPNYTIHGKALTNVEDRNEARDYIPFVEYRLESKFGLCATALRLLW